MAGDKAEQRRKTWTIGELCREFGVTARALRFYEQKGLLRPERQGWKRLYDARERQRLQMILRGKKAGFTLAEIREMLELTHLREGETERMEKALARMRQQLDVLRERRAEIDEAIADLARTIDIVEGMLKERRGG
jgi:DNA-binding transcriptional MerR regulator